MPQLTSIVAEASLVKLSSVAVVRVVENELEMVLPENSVPRLSSTPKVSVVDLEELSVWLEENPTDMVVLTVIPEAALYQYP